MKTAGKYTMMVSLLVELLAIGALAFWRAAQGEGAVAISNHPLAVALVVVMAGCLVSLVVGGALYMFGAAVRDPGTAPRPPEPPA